MDGVVLGLDPRVINVSAADLISRLQPAVDAASVHHNVSFAVGVRTAFGGTVYSCTFFSALDLTHSLLLFEVDIKRARL